LAVALKNFNNLHTLELNSCEMDNETLKEISAIFPPKLRKLSLMDNLISDEGL
jgi:Ran GTPase-activating protein (RanGAP) involved in mRNA processing and transport